MFKQFVALIRGRSFDAAETVLDGNALVILRQQIRDCAEAVNAARRAVAIAMAQNEQEISQCKRIIERIADLEARTIAAIGQGKSGLARDAAESIACLEAERDTSLEAQRTFAGEIERLKRVVRSSETRLREIERGQRLASAAQTTQRLRETVPGSGLSTLKDAEATLARLRDRQKHMELTAAAMERLDLTCNPASVAEKLAEAGCGMPLKSTADDVLARLAARAAKPE